MKKILNTTFETIVREDGKKSFSVNGPLAGAILLVPFFVTGAWGFALGRLTKR
jgi:hypothetical protein